MVVITFYPYFSGFKAFSVSLTILIIPSLLYYVKVKSSVKRFKMPSQEDYQRNAINLDYLLEMHFGVEEPTFGTLRTVNFDLLAPLSWPMSHGLSR